MWIILLIIIACFNDQFKCHAEETFTTCPQALLNTRVNQTKKCRFRQYRTENVVSCLDRISAFSSNLTGGTRDVKKHLVFLGDSRMRQQFYSFLKMLPNHDFVWYGPENEVEIRQLPVRQRFINIDVDSNILNARISFRWRHLINATVFQDIQHWLSAPYMELLNLDKLKLTFLLIGVTTHHMFPKYRMGLPVFKKNLEKLKQYLISLSKIAHVIWMNQLSVIDDPRANPHQENHPLKFDLYKRAARHILKYSHIIMYAKGIF